MTSHFCQNVSLRFSKNESDLFKPMNLTPIDSDDPYQSKSACSTRWSKSKIQNWWSHNATMVKTKGRDPYYPRIGLLFEPPDKNCSFDQIRIIETESLLAWVKQTIMTLGKLTELKILTLSELASRQLQKLWCLPDEFCVTGGERIGCFLRTPVKYVAYVKNLN